MKWLYTSLVAGAEELDMALAKMDADGWELVTCTAEPVNQESLGSNRVKYRLIFRNEPPGR